MSSTKPTNGPKTDEPKKPRGVQPKKPSGVVKLATPEVISAVKQPVPAGQLEATPQSFGGIPAPTPPIGRRQERIFVASLANPVITPLTGPLPKRVPSDTGPSLPAPPPPTRSTKPLRFIKPTANYVARTQDVDEDLQADIDTKMEPIFKEYQVKQNEIESKNPYQTSTAIYTPSTRKSFYRFISDTYSDTFNLIPQVKGRIDEDACAKLGAAAGTAVEAFLYQKFIREYIRNAGPYRGILVYHGLGSGKTCSAIAAAEALYGTSNKKIIVMTPASLRNNFMSEISFCGFRHFSVHNHWVAESLISEGGISYMYARSVLSLSDTYLKRVLRRDDEERKVIWIPNFEKESNYESLTQQERDDIRAQITETIDGRITFISYNGITAKQLKKWACTIDPVTNERFFDNSVIVVDEVHNLSRLMQGEITPYTVERKGKPRLIRAEPIVPGRWKPGLCESPLNYKRSYLLYKLLTDARNSKIIALSGTPIINFPDELAILANLLAGYTECAKFILKSTDKVIMDKLKSIAEEDLRVDIVRFKAMSAHIEVLISVFNEGYMRVKTDESQAFIGVQHSDDPAANDGIREVYPRIKAKLKAQDIPISDEEYISYPRLPIDPDVFKANFINSMNLSITNKTVLQKRLTGLISYYKGSKEEYMPRVIKDEVVKCEMSDYTLSMYTIERIKEIEVEEKKLPESSADKYAQVEKFAQMFNSSSYRFRSRALCNFAFPKSIVRPFPESEEQQEEEVVDAEDLDIAEMEMEADKDLVAQEAVALEAQSIPDPEKSIDEDDDEDEGEEDKEDAEDLERVVEAVEEKAVNAVNAVNAVKPTKGGSQDGGVTNDESDAPKPAPAPKKRTKPRVAPSSLPVAVAAVPVPAEAVEAVAAAPVPAEAVEAAPVPAEAVEAVAVPAEAVPVPVQRVPRRKPKVAQHQSNHQHQ